jgi:hypothetical protein
MNAHHDLRDAAEDINGTRMDNHVDWNAPEMKDAADERSRGLHASAEDGLLVSDSFFLDVPADEHAVAQDEFVFCFHEILCSVDESVPSPD